MFVAITHVGDYAGRCTDGRGAVEYALQMDVTSSRGRKGLQGDYGGFGCSFS